MKYKKDFAKQARKLCEAGFIDQEIADFFEVSIRTIHRWKYDHPEFAEALTIGKDIADNRVEMSLYHKAVGYTFDSEKIFHDKGEIIRAPCKEHVPPSDTAAIFWLKNRRGWRDKQDHELSGKDGGPVQVGLPDELKEMISKIVDKG